MKLNSRAAAYNPQNVKNPHNGFTPPRETNTSTDWTSGSRQGKVNNGKSEKGHTLSSLYYDSPSSVGFSDSVFNGQTGFGKPMFSANSNDRVIHSSFVQQGIPMSQKTTQTKRRGMRPVVDQLVFHQEPEDEFSVTKIRVVQYNILADTYALETAFPYTKREYLNWNYRGRNIVQELVTYEADIITLQEVDHFSNFLQPQMRLYGYEGVFYKRPGSKRDGCAIFYRSSRFTAEDEFHLDYNELAHRSRRNSTPLYSSSVLLQKLGEMKNTGNNKSTDEAKDPSDSFQGSASQVVDGLSSGAAGDIWEAPPPRLERKNSLSQPSSPRSSIGIGIPFDKSRSFHTSNVAFGVYLVDKDGFGIWVVTTHLHWNPKLEEVKDAQASLLRKRVEELTKKYSPNTGVLLCGDINSTPNSSVYSILTENQSEQLDSHTAQFDSDDKKHSKHSENGHVLKLQSIFKERNEPSFTNFTQKFKGTLDYIFHTPNVLAPICALTTPPISDLEAETALPNAIYPSDHIAMVADMQWKRILNNPVACGKGIQCRDSTCLNIHPLLCKYKMDCKAAACRLSHVAPCKFGVTCKMRYCQFNHLPCRRGPCGRFCKRVGCPYSHVEVCRFGASCSRKECHYSHPHSPLAFSKGGLADGSRPIMALKQPQESSLVSAFGGPDLGLQPIFASPNKPPKGKNSANSSAKKGPTSSNPISTSNFPSLGLSFGGSSFGNSDPIFQDKCNTSSPIDRSSSNTIGTGFISSAPSSRHSSPSLQPTFPVFGLQTSPRVLLLDDEKDVTGSSQQGKDTLFGS